MKSKFWNNKRSPKDFYCFLRNVFSTFWISEQLLRMRVNEDDGGQNNRKFHNFFIKFQKLDLGLVTWQWWSVFVFQNTHVGNLSGIFPSWTPQAKALHSSFDCKTRVDKRVDKQLTNKTNWSSNQNWDARVCSLIAIANPVFSSWLQNHQNTHHCENESLSVCVCVCVWNKNKNLEKKPEYVCRRRKRRKSRYDCIAQDKEK